MDFFKTAGATILTLWTINAGSWIYSAHNRDKYDEIRNSEGTLLNDVKKYDEKFNFYTEWANASRNGFVLSSLCGGVFVVYCNERRENERGEGESEIDIRSLNKLEFTS